MNPHATYWHQEVLGRLATALRTWARTRDKPRPAVATAPLDVTFGADVLQPDIAIWLTGLPRSAVTPIAWRPDICIEVLSSNRRYDLEYKRDSYVDSGVPEYWVVDPAREMVWRMRGDQYAIRDESDPLTSSLLPGFSMPLASLFGADE